MHAYALSGCVAGDVVVAHEHRGLVSDTNINYHIFIQRHFARARGTYLSVLLLFVTLAFWLGQLNGFL